MSVELERQEPGDWEQLRRNNNVVAQNLRPVMPNARVFSSVNIAVPNAVVTSLPLDSERWDVGNLHSMTVNTSRLTAPVTGLYLVGANLQWAGNVTGERYLDFFAFVGGVGVIIAAERRLPGSVGNSEQVLVTPYRFAAGEWVESRVWQTSGGPLNVLTNAIYSPEFWMVRLGGYMNEGVA